MTSLHLYCSCGQRFRAICSDATAARISQAWQRQHPEPEHRPVSAEEWEQRRKAQSQTAANITHNHCYQ